MATYLTETLYRFCTRDMYSFWQQNRATYAWVANNWLEGNNDDEIVAKHAISALSHYLKNQKGCPKSIDGLIQYIIHNPDLVAKFERSEAAEDELQQLKDYEPMTDLDDRVLLASLLTEARRRWFIQGSKYAIAVSGGAKLVDKKSEETGTTAAIQYLRSYFTGDIQSEAAPVAGILHENIPTILAGLEEKLHPTQTSGKFPLGLSHIDSNVVVGKQNLRFIGILGMSGDGKTTLTDYIVYNWLCQGAHILYCSTEHSPQEIWEFMAFLHQSHPDYPFTLPGMDDWERGNVSKDDEFHMTKILCDIQDRKNLPGLLDVQQLRDWEDIKGHLEANHKKNRYDVLVVDYLARLDIPGADPRFRDKAVSAMVHDAQALSRKFDGGKGLIVLSPIQVNREAHKAALKAEIGEPRYNLNAISQISEYQNDLDLCLSVFSTDDMKMDSKVEIQSLKERKGRKAPPTFMRLDRNSGAFQYEVPLEQRKVWDRTVDDVEATEKTTISTENWGI